MRILQASITVDDYNLHGAEQAARKMDHVSDVALADYVHHIADGFPSRFTFTLHFERGMQTADLEVTMQHFARVVSENRP